MFVTIGGRRLEYEWHGPSASEAPTIVFLHEGLGSTSRWRDFPATLCARLGWGGLVYNRQGYGGSAPFVEPLSPQFMHHEALDVLPEVLTAFGVSRPVLFGHSDGGSIALIYAGSGRAVRALVLEAPHVFVEPLTVASIAAFRDTFASSDELRARLARHHGENTDPLFEFWTRIWLSDEFREWTIEQVVRAIACPTLVIQGRDDEYGTLRQVDAIAQATAGTVETLVLDGCGHSPHLDCRDAVETAAELFLNRWAVM